MPQAVAQHVSSLARTSGRKKKPRDTPPTQRNTSARRAASQGKNNTFFPAPLSRTQVSGGRRKMEQRDTTTFSSHTSTRVYLSFSVQVSHGDKNSRPQGVRPYRGSGCRRRLGGEAGLTEGPDRFLSMSSDDGTQV